MHWPRNGVREEVKHLNTSVNPAVMQARAEEENFSTRIALGVRLGSDAVEPQSIREPAYPKCQKNVI
jgi:hypothetical protein